VKPLALSFSASCYGEPATFGDYIRKARLEKEMKQMDVARAATRLFQWGGIEDDVMKQKVECYKSEKQRLTGEKDRLQAELAKVAEIEVRQENLDVFCKMLRQRVPHFSPEGKRLALEALGVEILVDGNRASVSGDFLDRKHIVSTPL